MERSWIAQIEGKKYYLLNLPEEEQAAQALARVLRYGSSEEEPSEVDVDDDVDVEIDDNIDVEV